MNILFFYLFVANLAQDNHKNLHTIFFLIKEEREVLFFLDFFNYILISQLSLTFSELKFYLNLNLTKVLSPILSKSYVLVFITRMFISFKGSTDSQQLR